MGGPDAFAGGPAMIGSWPSAWMAERAAARSGSKPEIRELTKIFMRALYPPWGRPGGLRRQAPHSLDQKNLRLPRGVRGARPAEAAG